MEKKKSRAKKIIAWFLTLLFSFLLGGLITFGGLFIVNRITGDDEADVLKGETFKISDVVVLNESANYSIENINTSISEVVVRGSKKQLNNIYVIKPELSIDESKINESGIYKMTAQLRAYDSDNNLIEDVEIVPGSIKVEIDVISFMKSLPIEVYTNGVPVQGRTISNIKINGQSVDDFRIIAYGDANVLANIESIPVTIDLKGTGINDTSTFNVDLSLPVGITNISEKKLEIVVTFSDSVTREIEINDVSIRNLKTGLFANKKDGSLKVIIEGTSEVINKITPKDINAYIDLQNYGVGEHNVEVILSSDYFFIYTIDNIVVNIYEEEKTEI